MFTPLNSLRAFILALVPVTVFGANVATLRRLRVKVGDLVVSARGHWHDPRLVVGIHETAKALVGVLWANGETKYVHYKHLEVVSER